MAWLDAASHTADATPGSAPIWWYSAPWGFK